MASTQPVFGATITPPTTTKPVTTPITTTDLPPDTTGQHTSPPAVTPASLRQPSFDITTATSPPPIYSPFYEHPPASHERILTPVTTPAAGSDLEKNEKKGPATFTRTVSSPDDCPVWPSKAAQQRARSRQRSTSRAAAGGILATPMRRLRRRCGELSSRTRLLLKLALALVLCGLVVAVGVGISAAVHGTVYVANGSAATVQGPHSR